MLNYIWTLVLFMYLRYINIYLTDHFVLKYLNERTYKSLLSLICRCAYLFLSLFLEIYLEIKRKGFPDKTCSESKGQIHGNVIYGGPEVLNT